jgi:ribosomal protein L4
LVVVAQPDEQALIRSFRNLERVAVVAPGDLEVAAVVWARSLLVTEGALPVVTGRAQ